MYKASRFLFFLSCLLCAQVWAGEERGIDQAIHFQAVDLTVNSGQDELAAYQVEIRYDARTVKIVGVEGGEREAFQTPPFYDENGFEGGRIILAAFTEKEEICPRGQVRVARIHLAVTSDENVQIQGVLMAAAKKGGKRFSPSIALKAAPKGGDSEE